MILLLTRSGSGKDSTTFRPLYTFTSSAELSAALSRDINALSDAVVIVRRASLRRLGEALFGVDFEQAQSPAGTEEGQPPTTPPLTPHVTGLLRGVWPDLMKPLLRRCSDGSEPCRLSAVRMVSGARVG